MGGTYVLTFPVKSLKTIFLLGHLCTLHLVLCFVGRLYQGFTETATRGVFRNFTKFTGKHLCQSLFFNKAAGLEASTLLKRLEHMYFPADVAKLLTTLILKNIFKYSFCNA